MAGTDEAQLGAEVSRRARAGTTVVGRDRELAELRGALRGTLAGHGGLWLLAGEPGVGKTALADALCEEAEAAGAVTLWGSAWEGGGAPAYWPWMRILRRLAERRDLDEAVAGLHPVTAARLVRLAPALHPAGTPGVEHDDEAPHARFALFDAVAALLRAASEEGPLVLVLDDLHAADHPSLLLLEFLASESRDVPLLLLGTFRDAEARLHPELSGVLGDLVRRGRRLPLHGLDAEHVGRLVERIAGERPPDQVVRAIHDATEGNPFFVDEVVRLLAAEGRLHRTTDDPLAGLSLPDGIRETIRRRLAPLSQRTRDALAIGAVIGREFRVAAVERVLEAEPAQLADALGEALSAGLVSESAMAPGTLVFAHGLIRDTLYNDLTPPRRAQLHRAAGEALEATYAGDRDTHLAELAHHFFQCAAIGDAGKAIRYSIDAGRRAMQLLAYEQAAGHFERALHAFGLEERADVPSRCDLLLSLGVARSRAGETRTARETFARAAGLARQLDSPDRLARAALAMGAGAGGFELGRADEELLALLREARDALAGRRDPLRARLLGRLATELYFTDRDDERRALSLDALALARELGDPAALASTLGARYLALWGPGDHEERAALAAEITALGQETGDRELVLRGHGWRAIALLEGGDLTGADLELAAHARLAEALRDPLHRAYVPLLGAMRALLDGELAQARALAEDALETGRHTQPRNALQLYAVQLFGLYAEQGRLDELRDAMADFVRRYPAAGVWRAGLAFCHGQAGRIAEARSELEVLIPADQPVLRRDGEWLTGMSLLAYTCAAVGDARRAEVVWRALAPYTDQVALAGRGALCLGPMARPAGVAAGAAGHAEEAQDLLRRAIARAQAWGAEPAAAGARADLADVLARTGDAQGASALREEAREAARRLGLGALLARLDGEGHTAPAPAPAVQQPPATGGEARGRIEQAGDVWILRPAGGRTVSVRDAKGMRYLAALLRAPHVEHHALELVAGGASRGDGSEAGGEGLTAGAGDAGPLLDEQARRAYQARIAEVRDELDEAQRFNDVERAARARAELEALAPELGRAVGLGGRMRRSGSDAERARVNVTRAIRTAIARIAEHDPELGRRLDRSVRTGTFCAYEPGPHDEVAWGGEA